MASSLGCLTDSLSQLNTSFLQLQVRVMDEKVDALSIALCFDFDLIRLISCSLNGDYSALLLQFEGWSLQGQRCWEARNVKKSGELMGVDLVFLDEKVKILESYLDPRFYTSIGAHRLNTFNHLLREGVIYESSKFQNINMNDYRLTICSISRNIYITLRLYIGSG
ncbi:unnamed protein product [Brassica oleracea]